MPQTSFTFALTPDQQQTLTGLLRDGNYCPMPPPPHAVIAAGAEGCTVTLYKSGKCLIQGKGAEDFVLFVMEPVVLAQAAHGYDDVVNPEATTPHMGIDESGKGDFFGPLVVAGAYVDEELAEPMRKLGVRDSKRITSDTKAMGMGQELRRLLGSRFTVVRIGPRKYNQLYARMRNVNRMLAWAHARVIENLLEAVPDCPRAISDQFGSEQQVKQALLQKGRRIELVQRHRAESDLAVAAASIIAREIFLRGLQEMSTQYGVTIPKGASAAVREAAAALGRDRGPEALLETVKCHFKTTDEVLKTLGTTRAALGPDGQAVSKTLTGARWGRKKAE
jgi:ribonuclease HIII